MIHRPEHHTTKHLNSLLKKWESSETTDASCWYHLNILVCVQNRVVIVISAGETYTVIYVYIHTHTHFIKTYWQGLLILVEL